MEDEEGRDRVRRHHRRLLNRRITTRLCFGGEGGSTSLAKLSASSLSSLRSMADDSGSVWIQDGPNKYVNAVLPRNVAHHSLVQTSARSLPRYQFLRSSKTQRPLSVQFFINEQRREGGLRDVMTTGNFGALLVGGLTVVLKIVGLLLTKTFFDDLWPYLQVFSVCTLSIDPLKLLVPGVRNIGFGPGPLQGLAGPVLGLTIARPLVRWGLPDLYRTARFWRRLLPIYFGYMKTKFEAKGKGQEDQNKMWAVRHEWGGDRVHRLVLDLSGFYVKSAQILATKADFVPEPWIRRLSNHFDNATPRPFPEVALSVQQQLGRCPQRASLPVDAKGFVPLEAVFSCVESTCIAAASIAQVHGAELKDGKRVVIKVQHLGMELVMKSDLRNIVWVAKFLEGQLPFDLGPVVREIQKTIPLEFDFEREIWFMTRIRWNLEKAGFGRIVCPLPVIDLCAKRLIVMERLEGIPFTRILKPDAPDELKRRIPEVVNLVECLVHAYGQMLLVDGVFHADPHAGNLLLLEDGQLGLIDFGQSKVLEKDLRKKLAVMILALYKNDERQIASSLQALGMLFKDINGGVVADSTLAVMARILFDTCYVREATISPMSPDSILKSTPLTTFNQDLWLVVRAMVILRGLCFGLKMDLSACTLWRPYALRALQELEHVSDE